MGLFLQEAELKENEVNLLYTGLSEIVLEPPPERKSEMN